MKETNQTVGPFGIMPQESWHPGKGAKPNRVIQLNYGEVRNHAIYKARFINQNMGELQQKRTKKILLSDELWLIANSSKGFEIWNKSMKINI